MGRTTMPSLHPFLVLTFPPETLTRGPAGLSIGNVAVAVTSSSQFLQLVPTNIAADLACVCGEVVIFVAPV